MRGNRGRLGWSVAVSVVGHGLVVALFCQFFNVPRPSPPSPKDSVDCRIEKPKEYATITMNLDDRHSRPSQTKPNISPKPPVQPLPIQPAESTNRGHEALPKDTSSDPKTVEAASGSSGVAPLHGKLTRPGLSIVYVLDRSGSMGCDRKLAHAIAVLKSSLRQLGPDVRFQIVAYDSTATIFRIENRLEVVLANSSNIIEAETQLAALRSEGGSRHEEGLRVGLGLHPDVLILLTDADELSVKEVRRIQKFNLKGTSIHAVLLGESKENSRSSLRELTGEKQLHFVSLPDRPMLMP